MALRDIAQIVVAVFVTLGGTAGVVALFKLRPERKRIEAEAHKIGVDADIALSATAVAMLEPMSKRIETLEARLAEADNRAMSLNFDLTAANARVRELEAHVRSLSAEIDQLRHSME